MRTPVRILVVSGLISAATFLHAAGQSRIFDHYTVRDGISQSEIKCLLQDAEGYLWIGTQNGLNKFDGYTFDYFLNDPLDSTSLSNNWIFTMTEDRDGNIWLGTKQGINLYEKKSGIFTSITYRAEQPQIDNEFVYGLASDNEYIYVSTPPVLTIIDQTDHSFETYQDDYEHDGAVHDIGYPVIKCTDGYLWIGSGQGLSIFDLQNRQFVEGNEMMATLQNDLHEQVHALYDDGQGNIMIGTGNGMIIFDKSTGRQLRFTHDKNDPNSLSHNTVHSVTRDDNGDVWIATGGGGLNMLPEGSVRTGTFTRHRSVAGQNSSLIHDIVFDLVEDRSNNLWVGTLSGLDKTDLKQKNIKRYHKSDERGSVDLADNVIASLFIDEFDMLWIGTWGKGLNILDRSTGKIFHYSSSYDDVMNIPEDHVHMIFRDSQSRIWLGTRDGVTVFNKASNRFIRAYRYFNVPGYDVFRNLRIYCMMEDHRGRIWIGTGNGLRILDPGSKEIQTIKAEDSPPVRISNNLVYSLLEDSDGEIWIATSNGLDRYDPLTGNVVHYLNDPDEGNTVMDNFTISLCEDRYGHIWIGTSSGANRFSKTDSVFMPFTLADGLPSNIIYNIIEDDNRDLWFATGGGLAVLNPDMNAPPPFSVVDELLGQEFNLKAVYRADDGELLFGGMEGIISFYPDSLRKNTYIPPVLITSLIKESAGGREELNAYQEVVRLSYQDYSLVIQFAALDYTHSSKNRYSYRMKGISDDWIDIGTRRFVNFTNLRPGEYVFSVKGSNNDGVWNESETSLKVIITPPWWQSDAAYIAFLVMVLLLIIFVIRRRERRFIREQRRLEKKVNARTAEISLQKEKVEASEARLKEMNATKDKFFSILAHDLKNPFSNLYSMSELINENYAHMDEEEKMESLRKINKSAEFIYVLLENLLTWSKTQRDRIDFQPVLFNLSDLVQVNINLHKIPAENKGVVLKTSMKEGIMAWGDREMINTVLRNLINNAVKFTGKGSEVEVIVNQNRQHLEVTVRDEGVGIPEEDLKKLFRIDVKFKTKGTSGESGTGLGLILCKEFVEKNQGTISCESTPGKGSRFTFTIPGQKPE